MTAFACCPVVCVSCPWACGRPRLSYRVPAAGPGASSRLLPKRDYDVNTLLFLQSPVGHVEFLFFITSSTEGLIEVFFLKFIYFERERESAQEHQREGGGESRERGSHAGSALSAQSPTRGPNPRTMRL